MRGTIERMATLGWLARLSIRLPGGETLVAHVPHDELGDAERGRRGLGRLRSPKAFGLETRTDAPDAPDALSDRSPDVVAT